MRHASELNNLGVADLASEELEMADKYFSKAMELMRGLPGCSTSRSVSDTILHFSKQKNLFQREDYDEGMDTFNKPVRIDATNALCHEVYSSILYNQGQYCVTNNAEGKAYTLFCQSLAVLENGGCSETERIKIVAILHNIGRIEYRCGLHDDAMNTYTKALETCHGSSSSKDVLAQAATLNCMAVVYFQLKKADTDKALSFCQTSLEIYRSILGSTASSTEIAAVINNLGRIQFLREEFKLALPAYREALSMRQKLLGADHMDVAATIFNIAQTSQALCEHEQALTCYEQFLGVARKHLGAKHRDIVAALKNMAEVHHDQGKYKEAKNLYNQALAMGRSCLDSCHQEMCGILNKLGNLMYEEQDYDAALKAYVDELDIERACLGECHTNVAITYTNIGQIYKRRQDYEQALAMYNQAIGIQRRALMHPNADVAATLSSVAFIYSQTNRFRESFNVYQEVLWIQRETLGEGSLESSGTLTSLGLVLYKMDQHELALDSFHESLKIRRAILGNNHHDVAICLYNIATVHLDRGQDEKALEHYEDALSVEQGIQTGDNHRDVASVLKQMGQIHQKNANLDGALKYYLQAVEELKKPADKDHLEISNILILIGSVHLQYGHAREVVDTCSIALRHFRLTGKDIKEFQLYGFNFYSLSKMHPKCAAVA